MSKEKRLSRITMYTEPSDPEDENSVRVLGRVELDGEARMVDDVTGEPDADLGDWINKAKNYAKDETPPQAVIDMVKTRFGI